MRAVATELTHRAGVYTLGELLAAQIHRRASLPALSDASRTIDYATLNDRVNRLAHVLSDLGVVRGDRVAILSENRFEYIEAAFAAAKIGAILCALNWRLSNEELDHCVGLVEPAVLLVSSRFAPQLASVRSRPGRVIELGDDYESRLAASRNAEPAVVAQPEDGLLLLYTSGTTGLPKGALISHRAELARMNLSRIDLGLDETDSFVAWAPMFHMASIEHAMHVLALGGKVIVVDGADIPRLVDLIETENQWWLVLLPGMIDRLVEELKRRQAKPKGIKLVGALADLVPTNLIAEASGLLQAPYWNTFGSTETGMLPAAGTRFPAGDQPASLAKTHNSLYLWRLVDAQDNDVKHGEPGEITVRGPTLFSGYWNAEAVNERDFRNGWFHMGDMFVENRDGTLSFVDRAKYLIKSGGENIYPVEIERVLLADPRVAEAVVVRRKDSQWGEVPVAFVLRADAAVTAEELIGLCRRRLSSYKCPREIRFVDSSDAFPRSTSGKIQRQAIEQWLDETAA